MLKESITYKDLDGNDLTEDFYFHLSKAEIAEMELSQGGGMQQYLQAVAASGNGKLIMETFKMFIAKSYGQRSLDNKSFVKTEQITNEFMGSDAYSVLFMKLVTDSTYGAKFVNGIMPFTKEELAKAEASIPVDRNEVVISREPMGAELAKPRTMLQYSEEELLAMPWDEFNRLMRELPGSNVPKQIIQIAMKKPKD